MAVRSVGNSRHVCGERGRRGSHWCRRRRDVRLPSPPSRPDETRRPSTGTAGNRGRCRSRSRHSPCPKAQVLRPSVPAAATSHRTRRVPRRRRCSRGHNGGAGLRRTGALARSARGDRTAKLDEQVPAIARSSGGAGALLRDVPGNARCGHSPPARTFARAAAPVRAFARALRVARIPRPTKSRSGRTEDFICSTVCATDVPSTFRCGGEPAGLEARSAMARQNQPSVYLTVRTSTVRPAASSSAIFAVGECRHG